VNQRPFPSVANGIGPWKVAFELLGVLSVITNTALIALHPEVRAYLASLNDIQYFLFFVAIEVSLIELSLVWLINIPFTIDISTF
jgi:hypothetical protein